MIIDFEGEPARPLFERRQKRSPAARRGRDAALVRLRRLGRRDHARAARRPAQFEEQRPRASFLEHYFATIDPALLPGGEAAIINLLSIFELEKAIYELQYELDNRPDWLPIPVAGIARLLGVRMTTVAKNELEALVRREHPQPHAVLGAHPADGGVVVRALRPSARDGGGQAQPRARACR